MMAGVDGVVGVAELALIVCLVALSLASPALAASPDAVRVGVEIGASWDLPGSQSTQAAVFSPGPTIAIPLRVALTDQTRLRLAVRGDTATGRDRVTWASPAPGPTVTLYDDDHFAMPVLGTALVGLEVVLPLDTPLEVTLGVDTGVAWVGTFHSLGGATRPLLDPAQNDLQDPNNIDPYTTQLAWMNGVDVGLAVPFGDGLHLTVRTGYSGAFLNARTLQKTPAALDAQRAAYGFNPVRLAVGVERSF